MSDLIDRMMDDFLAGKCMEGDIIDAAAKEIARLEAERDALRERLARYESPLTDDEREQAHKVGRWLAGLALLHSGVPEVFLAFATYLFCVAASVYESPAFMFVSVVLGCLVSNVSGFFQGRTYDITRQQ